MSLMENVVALQTRIADANRERIRAEVAHDAAKQAAERARTALFDEFGVRSVEQAEQLLTEMRDELTALHQQISDQLDQIGI